VSQPADLVPVAGGCHCGAVRFRGMVEREPEVLDCNCSICSLSGYLHLFIPHQQFELESGSDCLTSYRFGSGQAEHIFCNRCGTKSFYQPRSHPDCWSVHLKALYPGHELAPNIRKFDGQNWEAAKREL